MTTSTPTSAVASAAPGKAPARAPAPAVSVAGPVEQPAAEQPAAAAARVERLRVPGDLPASIVFKTARGAPTTIFLPGICSNASAYLESFPETARAHGGILAIDGDVPCPKREGSHSFSWDAARQHARIEAALAAAGVETVGAEGITVIGYSQGASIAEELAARWPNRYTRVVLIGAPKDPLPAHFRQARGLVTMSCSLDVVSRMREAARKTSLAGTPATFFEMPGCTHGNVADAEHIFDEALSWLDTNGKPTPDGARDVVITGPL
ncbi:MAG: alpha/beta hydrolase [Polyangiaceae bacterium]|nr:alpha/beta hydrolase [Polyangiaceae bacterium]